MGLNSISEVDKKRYRSLFSKLRKRRSSDDDRELSRIHDAVFEATDCLACANCCKTHSPLFTLSDISRISRAVNLSESKFTSMYLLLDEDGDWIFQSVPCPFLQADNKCGIYEDRPKACREYPHTNRKKIYQIEDLTIKNAEICPAVSKILDTMERAVTS